MSSDSNAQDFGRLAELYGNPPELPALYFVSSAGSCLTKVMGVQSAESLFETIRIAQAKNKIELVRLLKESETKDAAEKAEMQRRDSAKLVQESRKQMEDRRLALESARAKEAAEASRRHGEEVREKIRADRDERRRKNDSTQSLPQEASSPSVSASVSPPSSASQSAASRGCAKIKFIVGDENFAHEFSSADSLGTMRAYVASQGYSNFTLETVFPRRTLLIDDNNRSLAQLDLTPACAVIVNLNSANSLRGVGGRVSSAFASAAPAAPAQSVHVAQPTIHPNVDSTYIHPSDTSTFFNDICNGLIWCRNKIANCRGPQQRRPVAPAAPANASPASASRTAAASRSRNGPYEALDRDEF